MRYGTPAEARRNRLALSGVEWLQNEVRELVPDPALTKKGWHASAEGTLTTPAVHGLIDAARRATLRERLSWQESNAPDLAVDIVARLCGGDFDEVRKVYQDCDRSAALPVVTATV